MADTAVRPPWSRAAEPLLIRSCSYTLEPLSSAPLLPPLELHRHRRASLVIRAKAVQAPESTSSRLSVVSSSLESRHVVQLASVSSLPSPVEACSPHCAFSL
ncbi:hypothetical protein Syun_027841 [Stephania yunnanensis]|uniref:Uncharacterized protein n=1 Tax=Stephania yunnanensis TaxID=152371 RepID=A0AAP0EIR0_9MAGN